MQSSGWAEVKSGAGWRTSRVVERGSSGICGGAQILLREARFAGTVGYVARGPVLSSADPDLFLRLMDKIREFAHEADVSALFVQPPGNTKSLAGLLATRGFQPTPVEPAPAATLMIDLHADLDQILAGMRKSTRGNVRRSQRRGVVVRLGGSEDLPTFSRLNETSARRRGFTPYDQDYFVNMWRRLAPRRQLKLFLSEYRGEVVAAQLVIAFSDTVVAKYIGWSGEHGKVYPNEALDWATIEWAKSEGYHYYDLEGINKTAAEALLAGQPLPQTPRNGPTGYKCGLGGKVQLFAPSYCYIANRAVRWIHGQLGSRLTRSGALLPLINRFRTSRGG